MKKIIFIAIPMIILLLICIISLTIGTRTLSLQEVIQGIVDPDTRSGLIIWRLRMPRVILALLAGGLLATSGMILQATVKNELASPDVIGLNKASALVIVCMNFFIAYPTKAELVGASIIGALLCAVMLYLISRLFQFSTQTIVITGVALSFFFDAALKLITINERQLLIKQMLWLTGSLWGRSWEMVPILFLTTTVFVIFFYVTRRRFFLLQLDAAILPTLGQDERKLSWLYIVVSAIVSGITVSTVGAIGFIGLIAPHISRRLMPVYSTKRFFVTFYFGSIILLLADLIGRSLFGVIEVPAGIIVAIIGGPYFLLMLIQQRKWRNK